MNYLECSDKSFIFAAQTYIIISMVKKATLTERRYFVPFVLITTLFFLWGFARAILDVLNKHFQEALDISITKSAFIQVITYLAYFLMAIPAGVFINRYGYRKGVVFGLLLFGIGALLFIPASYFGASAIFYGFLLALFILGCGLTFLETAANPYSTELGPRETATSRLNLSQSFNGLGSCIAPAIVGGYLFSGGDVTQPYVIMGVIVLVIALIFSRVELPEIKHEAADEESDVIEGNPYRKLLEHKMFVFGLVALLLYEVAEISINSYFVNFTTMPHVVDGEMMPGLMSAKMASMILSGALVLFMVGRFIGSAVMTRVRAELVLIVCAICCSICMGIIFLGPGKACLFALCANYFFESIMFPTIFALALRGMGGLTKTASSILMMTPVGGCFFLLTGYIADAHLLLPFVIPFVCYVVIVFFAYTILCRKGVSNEVK